MASSGEDDRCPLTDLPRYSCGHCTGARPREQVGQIVSMTAKYMGSCAYCDDPIRPGQQIRRVSGTMDWIHVSHDRDA
jgi:hypothetical protein